MESHDTLPSESSSLAGDWSVLGSAADDQGRTDERLGCLAESERPISSPLVDASISGSDRRSCVPPALSGVSRQAAWRLMLGEDACEFGAQFRARSELARAFGHTVCAFGQLPRPLRLKP